MLFPSRLEDPFEQFWNDLQASGELVDVAESAESTTKSAPRPEHAPEPCPTRGGAPGASKPGIKQ